ncbi:MAG: DUF4190 domain-containing protein [Planctomycetota bacterium]|jgi:hypothetical protein
MSHLDSPPFDATATEPQKTSGLAVASLVCSLICCIPLTTIPGILLGIGAMISIGGDPAKKGKGMAITGIVLGVIFTVMQAVIYPPAIGYVKATMGLVWGGPRDALAMGFAGDTAGFKDQFHGAGASAGDVEAQAFIDELRRRYGEYSACYFDEAKGQPSQPGFGATSVPFPYVIEFANAQVESETEIVFSDPQVGGIVNKLGYVTIFDAELGDLTYPAPVEEMIEEAAEAIDVPAEVPTEGDGG